MKTQITLEQVMDAHHLVQAVISTIFDHEEDFKSNVLGRHGWGHEDYEIGRCHAALRYRITLKHYDGREKDLYIENSVVYSWLNDLGILEE